MIVSKFGPAVAQTKRPASSKTTQRFFRALSRRAASPVMITAPVSISSRASPAAWNVASTSSRSGAASMFQSPVNGVSKIGERAITRRSNTIGRR